MKKIIFTLLIISLNVLEAQENKPFSNFDIGVYGGINFYNSSNIGGDFFIELKTNLISSLKLKVCYRLFQNYSAILRHCKNIQ